MRHHHSPGIRGQLMWFLCCICLFLLRRDQIWFAEKNEKTMQTDIYALTEFSPRKGENISKGYLQGRYTKNSSSRI